MGYQYWPSGLPPYQPKTYITDIYTALNSESITDGLAKDVASLQHNINTTNLFASGWLHPVESGYFKNIDTLNLYAETINTRILTLSGCTPNINELKITGTTLYTNKTAFIGNTIKSNNGFKGTAFSLDSNGFIYDGNTVSSQLYQYELNRNTNEYYLVHGNFNNLTVRKGNINVSGLVDIENIQRLTTEGSLNESSIYWNAFGGHDHSINKIAAHNISGGNIEYTTDLNIQAKGSGFININTGVLQANSYETITQNNTTDFEMLDLASIGVYSNSIDISGKIKDLEIGVNKMVSYNGYIWTSSKLKPSATDNNVTYLYYTKNLSSWNVIEVQKNSISDTFKAEITDILVHRDNLYYLLNSTSDDSATGNACSLGKLNTNLTTTNIITYTPNDYNNSSKYGVGISSVDEFISVYGYRYPYTSNDKIHQWDKYGIYESDGEYNIFDTYASPQSPNMSGVIQKHKYPFMNIYVPENITETSSTRAWLDNNTSNNRDRLSNINSGVYNTLPQNTNTYHYHTPLFGNGFSEITSLLPLTTQYNTGKKGYFTYLNDVGILSGGDLAESNIQNPVLLFGTFTMQVMTQGNNNIFGGCVPIVMPLDRRLFSSVATNNHYIISSGNAIFAPGILHGSRSLMDDNYLYRLPSQLYVYGLAHSSIWKYRLPNRGRFWTDISHINNTVSYDTLINTCPWEPGYGVFPCGASGSIYYKHDDDPNPTKLDLINSSSNGLVIQANDYDHYNMPTYYDRKIKDGFWSTKTFDWYYMPTHVIDSYYPPNEYDYAALVTYNDAQAPSGSYPKTYYYMRPKSPIQHNGSIYCILEYNTGYIYIGPNGPTYIDDDIMYSDLIKYGSTIYGVGYKITSINGEYTKELTITSIKKGTCDIIKLPNGVNSTTKTTPKFLIHENILYIGLGGGVFLIKKPSSLDLNIITNL